MTSDMKALFDERLGRYHAAISLEPHDRIPIATGSNYFAEIYSGNTKQETLYDPDTWLQAEIAFCKDFPEVDVLRDNRIYGPLFDALDVKTYSLPGKDLAAESTAGKTNPYREELGPTWSHGPHVYVAMDTLA